MAGTEPVPGKDKPLGTEIAIPHRNPGADIIPPLPIQGIPYLTRTRKLIIPLIKAIQPAVIRIIFLTFTIQTQIELDVPLILLARRP